MLETLKAKHAVAGSAASQRDASFGANSDVQAMVSLKDVTLKYGDLLALDSTTISIRPSEFIAVVGPRGCGSPR